MGKGGLVVLGGSAGSFKVVTNLLGRLPQGYPLPLVLCLHRLKDVRSGFMESLQGRSNLEVREPYDKELIQGGRVYLAPSNYHLYVELGNRFGLSTGEPVNHSRPSIDLGGSGVSGASRGHSGFGGQPRWGVRPPVP